MTAWPIAPLGKVVTHRKEFIQIDDSCKYKRCRVQLHAQGIVLRDEVPGIEIKTKAQQVCREGEFLVAEIDAKVGGFGIVPPSLEGAIVSGHYFLFSVDSSVLDVRFLGYYIKTAAFRDQVLAQGSTNYAAIRPSHVLAYTMPLPPIEEQRRIVERVRELSLKVKSAQQLADESDQCGDVIMDSWISQLTFSEGDWATLASAVDDKPGAVRSGPFGSQLHHGEFVAEGIAAISTRDVQMNRLSLRSGWFVAPEKFDQFRRYQVFPGNLLCTIVGASIGRFCAVPEGVPTAFTTKHIMALTLNQEISEPEYVSQILNSHKRSRTSIFSQCEGSAQPSLNARKVLAIELPLPPLARQRAILSQIKKMRAATQRLRDIGAVRKQELDALTPSLLHRACSGQL